MDNDNTDTTEERYLEVKPSHSFLDMKVSSIAILTIIVFALDVAADVISSLAK
jgi:hypothetical protein